MAVIMFTVHSSASMPRKPCLAHWLSSGAQLQTFAFFNKVYEKVTAQFHGLSS
jgi:hypothetical protein